MTNLWVINITMTIYFRDKHLQWFRTLEIIFCISVSTCPLNILVFVYGICVVPTTYIISSVVVNNVLGVRLISAMSFVPLLPKKVIRVNKTGYRRRGYDTLILPWTRPWYYIFIFMVGSRYDKIYTFQINNMIYSYVGMWFNCIFILIYFTKFNKTILKYPIVIYFL